MYYVLCNIYIMLPWQPLDVVRCVSYIHTYQNSIIKYIC